jgi:hypothetical protein
MNKIERKLLELRPNSPQSIMLPDGIDINFRFFYRYNRNDIGKTVKIVLKSGVYNKHTRNIVLPEGDREGVFELPSEHIEMILQSSVDELVFESSEMVFLEIVPDTVEVSL